MANSGGRAVVDAGVLIAYLNREKGRYEQSRDLLDDAEEGRVELWAPMVIQVEVSRWSKEAPINEPTTREKLEGFLESEWLRLIEVDRRMARVARDVVATTPIRTGIDALYVATAVLVEAPVVYSWDERVCEATYQGVTGAVPPGAAEPKLDLPS